MAKPDLVVLGAGAWGTALANLAARNGLSVTLWTRHGDQAAALNQSHENRRYLPGIALHHAIVATDDLGCVTQADIVVAATPAQTLRAMAQQITNLIRPGAPLVSASKGIEQDTRLFLSQISEQLLPQTPYAILSGPSFAADVARGLPTAVTLGCADAALGQKIARCLSTPWFRLYLSDDMRGVEIGGACKNVIAIACGVASGRGFGASAVAALATRGFAEIARFGKAFGARPQTLAGLSGLGDLMLTCNSPQSRNFLLGQILGRGEPAPPYLAEGAHTAPVLLRMAQEKNIEMPIAEAVTRLLVAQKSVNQVIEDLLARPLGSEGL